MCRHLQIEMKLQRVWGMKEGEIKKIRKTLEFEKIGETLAIEIEIINVSPEVKQETIFSMLDTLYEKAKKSIS